MQVKVDKMHAGGRIAGDGGQNDELSKSCLTND